MTDTWVVAADGRHWIYEYGGSVVLGTTDASEAPVQIHGPVVSFMAAAFTPDARLAVTALWDDEKIRVWDVKTKVELDAIDLSANLDHATALAISKKGDELFVGTARGIVYRFSVSRPEPGEPRLPPRDPQR